MKVRTYIIFLYKDEVWTHVVRRDQNAGAVIMFAKQQYPEYKYVVLLKHIVEEVHLLCLAELFDQYEMIQQIFVEPMLYEYINNWSTQQIESIVSLED